MRVRGWLLVLLLVACTPQPAPVTTVGQSDWVKVYFTDPHAPAARSVRGGPDEDLAAALRAAQHSIHMAIYDLNLWSIRDALLAAHADGVDVRLVVEMDNVGRRELKQLQQAGIRIVLDSNPSYMHNKFVIIDGYEVWTSSSNFTVSDMYGNYNNILRLRFTELAANYEAEFTEMFDYGYFGGGGSLATPHTQLWVGQDRVETYFSPDDRVARQLVALIDAAQESVYFLAYSLTLDEIGDALVAAQQRGVEVRGLMDNGQANNQGGEYGFLRQNGVNVRLDAPGPSLHSKVLIIDADIVVAGSYNFSSNAEFRNDENVLVIASTTLAAEYLQEFERAWQLAQP